MIGRHTQGWFAYKFGCLASFSLRTTFQNDKVPQKNVKLRLEEKH